MASGSYHPPPVRLVEIPKATGGTRPLGIPTVADRVAQTAVTMVLEPLVEPHFHPDSYAYRPGRSALDAVGTARKPPPDIQLHPGQVRVVGNGPLDQVTRHEAPDRSPPDDPGWPPAQTAPPPRSGNGRVHRPRSARTGGPGRHIAFDFLGYTFQPRRAKNRCSRCVQVLRHFNEALGKWAARSLTSLF